MVIGLGVIRNIRVIAMVIGLPGLLARVHENQSVQLGAFSAMGVCHGEIP